MLRIRMLLEAIQAWGMAVRRGLLRCGCLLLLCRLTLPTQCREILRRQLPLLVRTQSAPRLSSTTSCTRPRLARIARRIVRVRVRRYGRAACRSRPERWKVVWIEPKLALRRYGRREAARRRVLREMRRQRRPCTGARTLILVILRLLLLGWGRGGMRECALRCELLLRLRLGLLLLERARAVGEVVLAAALLKEVRGWLGDNRPLVGEAWISWHDIPLGHSIAWIWAPEWTAESGVGAETWWTLGRLTCTRCKHTVRQPGARAITWSMHVFWGACEGERGEKRRG